MIDLSFIFGAIIAAMLAFMLYKVWPAVKAFLPAGALYFVDWFADSVVRAVESVYYDQCGSAKREKAFVKINDALAPMVTFMNKLGYTISAENIYDTIETAWVRLDIEERKAREPEYEIGSDDVEPDEELDEDAEDTETE